MRVLIACEFSGIVRDAFVARGHDAWSCDLLKTERPRWNLTTLTQKRTFIAGRGQHIQGDVLRVLDDGWDLMVAHPPCKHLAVSGARWFETKQVEQRKAIYFFLALARSRIKHICIENPVSIMSTVWRKPDQYIQPWQFGHGETKKTGLWLKNLPLLEPTKIVEGRKARVHREPPGPERWKNRSRTYTGIAEADSSAIDPFS